MYVNYIIDSADAIGSEHIIGGLMPVYFEVDEEHGKRFIEEFKGVGEIYTDLYNFFMLYGKLVDGEKIEEFKGYRDHVYAKYGIPMGHLMLSKYMIRVMNSNPGTPIDNDEFGDWGAL